MAVASPLLTGKERSFPEDDIIVSKTDLKGRITYGNDVFLRIAGYTEAEILGKPHNIVRHPDMPRCVFKLLWDRIEVGHEIFAYVKNLAKNGDHYWVLAHVTPVFNPDNHEILGYHSSRRVPHRGSVAKAEAIFATLLAEEQRHASIKAGMAASYSILTNLLRDKGLSYDQFVLGL